MSFDKRSANSEAPADSRSGSLLSQRLCKANCPSLCCFSWAKRGSFSSIDLISSSSQLLDKTSNRAASFLESIVLWLCSSNVLPVPLIPLGSNPLKSPSSSLSPLGSVFNTGFSSLSSQLATLGASGFGICVSLVETAAAADGLLLSSPEGGSFFSPPRRSGNSVIFLVSSASSHGGVWSDALLLSLSAVSVLALFPVSLESKRRNLDLGFCATSSPVSSFGIIFSLQSDAGSSFFPKSRSKAVLTATGSPDTTT
mmetsp:Transcript_9872/g.21437  ORF Transcript_9872/g.21437 Transcript_9872/m.21437 type:complete len:255 (+) Transcript_9872:1693-2457(+)